MSRTYFVNFFNVILCPRWSIYWKRMGFKNAVQKWQRIRCNVRLQCTPITNITINKSVENLTATNLDIIFHSDLYYMPPCYTVSLHFPKFSCEKINNFAYVSKKKSASWFIKFSDFYCFILISTGNETRSKFIQYRSKIQPNEESNIIQVARIETVDTDSSSTATLTTKKHITEFNANRPFIFMIHDQKINRILFAGIYRGKWFYPLKYLIKIFNQIEMYL